MLRLNCRTLAIAGSCSMFIGMKTAIKSDHITINCIKINGFILFLFYFLNCSLTHSVTVSTTSTLNARTTTVLFSLFDFSLFFSLPFIRKLFILLYWFKHIKLMTLQQKITTYFRYTLSPTTLYVLMNSVSVSIDRCAFAVYYLDWLLCSVSGFSHSLFDNN